MTPFVCRDGRARVALRVVPKARRAGLGGVVTDAAGQPRLKVHVNAPADGGKANRAVLKLLAKTWRLAPTQLAIIQGAANRDKLVAAADAVAVQRWWQAWAVHEKEKEKEK
ncbi:MAG: DUF167 domain-containing protein, partial [Alphaproteobacteria bacterium]